MLVLSRRVGERIFVGDQVTITVVRITGGGVRLGIEAPTDLPVVREELRDARTQRAPSSSPGAATSSAKRKAKTETPTSAP